MEELLDIVMKAQELSEITTAIQGMVVETGVQNPPCGAPNLYKNVPGKMSGVSCSDDWNNYRNSNIEVARLECIGFSFASRELRQAKGAIAPLLVAYKSCFTLNLGILGTKSARLGDAVSQYRITSYQRMKELNLNFLQPFIRRQSSYFKPLFADHARACNEALLSLPSNQRRNASCKAVPLMERY